MREVHGELRDSQDEPVRQRKVLFVRPKMVQKNGRFYLPDSVMAVTDDTGQFSVNLIETSDSELDAFWRCTLPGHKPFEFDLAPGVGAIDIATLIPNE